MMNTRKTTKTPAMLPWIPSGQSDKDKSKNVYVHKKNSKVEDGLDLGHSKASDAFRGRERGVT